MCDRTGAIAYTKKQARYQHRCHRSVAAPGAHAADVKYSRAFISLGQDDSVAHVGVCARRSEEDETDSDGCGAAIEISIFACGNTAAKLKTGS